MFTWCLLKIGHIKLKMKEKRRKINRIDKTGLNHSTLSLFFFSFRYTSFRSLSQVNI